ncbi:dienelactone hydrolase [Emticicia oligotrophica DSM 17448]|uniref:Dienelactone hydrolase n=1 Tax=Emticicia oligotrophica (strain DSM 17448 / CIP 109782 / MTCC 6937 / GPTSA100-15) TaxID=929562 RepID=A0ABN4APM1_EMTOG|nr:alpha/beta hydrolase [Emticicia oligotrophica]AFK04304.1 dienelactone hydrolase [Emticicia oligotrophica DSM 17448]
MKKTFILLFFCIKIFAQPKPDFAKSAIEASKSWIDIDYVGDGIIGHKLDIFLPNEGKGPFPVVVTIYGSAWFSNTSKATCFNDGLGQTLLKNGFAVVSINHRSSRDAIWPAQIHDVKAAIRFVRANASVFSLDTSFLGITGFSSGGHLSTMAGVTSGIKSTTINHLPIDLEGNIGKSLGESSNVDAVVDWFGPTDFLLMDACGSSFSHNEAKSPESTLIGGAIQENKEKVALANPISYVSKATPPFLIFHGTKDPLVPHCESEKLYEKMQKEGVKSELIIIEGGGHGPGVMIDKYYVQMITFFKSKIKK